MKLIVEQGSLAGQEFPLQKPVISIGRGADNDLVIREQGVSRHHARLERGPQGWLLTDTGSTNGTRVNEKQIQAQEAHLLCPGDRVQLGDAVLVFQQAPAASQQKQERPAPRAARKPNPALLVVGAVCLIVVLVGLVFLLVTVLQPEEAMATPTIVEPMEHLMTALPVPTEFGDMITAVATWLPSGLSLPGVGGTPSPTP